MHAYLSLIGLITVLVSGLVHWGAGLRLLG
jgi:hypothetical protein